MNGAYSAHSDLAPPATKKIALDGVAGVPVPVQAPVPVASLVQPAKRPLQADSSVALFGEALKWAAVKATPEAVDLASYLLKDQVQLALTVANGCVLE